MQIYFTCWKCVTTLKSGSQGSPQIFAHGAGQSIKPLSPSAPSSAPRRYTTTKKTTEKTKMTTSKVDEHDSFFFNGVNLCMYKKERWIPYQRQILQRETSLFIDCFGFHSYFLFYSLEYYLSYPINVYKVME